MWYLLVALLSVAITAVVCYRYGRQIENQAWKDFMAARGFAEHEFEAMKKAYDRGLAVVKKI